MWSMHDVGWGWWLISSIGMLAFWGLVIYGVVMLLRNAGPSAPRAREHEAPEEVLKRRLAAGEIDLEEYERLREALRRDAPAGPPASALR